MGVELDPMDRGMDTIVLYLMLQCYGIFKLWFLDDLSLKAVNEDLQVT